MFLEKLFQGQPEGIFGIGQLAATGLRDCRHHPNADSPRPLSCRRASPNPLGVELDAAGGCGERLLQRGCFFGLGVCGDGHPWSSAGFFTAGPSDRFKKHQPL